MRLRRAIGRPKNVVRTGKMLIHASLRKSFVFYLCLSVFIRGFMSSHAGIPVRSH